MISPVIRVLIVEDQPLARRDIQLLAGKKKVF